MPNDASQPTREKASSRLVNVAVLGALHQHRITISAKPGQRLTFAADFAIEPYAGVFRGLTLPRRMGAYSYSNSPLHRLTVLGRYCAIAAGVSVMGNGHPHTWVSVSPFSYGSWRSHANIAEAIADAGQAATWPALRFQTSQGAPVIGHDVWIGQDVLLAQGVTIGNGAVIAAGAIVTKDVAPYTIIGGAPARVLRSRFPDALVERLQASQWWQYRFTDFAGMAFDQPAMFLDQLGERVAAGEMEPYRPVPMTARDLAAAAPEGVSHGDE
jgi:virginiamycin A acetyltransferase